MTKEDGSQITYLKSEIALLQNRARNVFNYMAEAGTASSFRTFARQDLININAFILATQEKIEALYRH